MGSYRATTLVGVDELTLSVGSGPDPWFRLCMETNGDSNGEIKLRSVQHAELLVTMLQQAIACARKTL